MNLFEADIIQRLYQQALINIKITLRNNNQNLTK